MKKTTKKKMEDSILLKSYQKNISLKDEKRIWNDDTVILLKKIFKFTSYFLAISFALGFLIWNTFLYGLGFKEDGILQTRFIYTGIFFIIFSFPLICCVILLFRKIKLVKSNFWSTFCKSFLITACLIYYFFYVYAVFTRLPLVSGGGRPRALSLMVNSEQLKIFNKFGIKNPPESTMQTGNICIAYENDKNMIIVLKDRVLQIERNQIDGLISLPGISTVFSRECSRTSRLWIQKQFLFEFLKDEQIYLQIINEQQLFNKEELKNYTQ